MYCHLYLSVKISKGEFLYSTISNLHDCSKRFTLYSLVDLFNQTPSRLLIAINAEDFVHKYSPLSIARCSFIQLSELYSEETCLFFLQHGTDVEAAQLS